MDPSVGSAVWNCSVALLFEPDDIGFRRLGCRVRLDEPKLLIDAARDLGEQVGRVDVAELGREANSFTG